jgi:DNA-directed RNA polymerase specialized sigma24 family protein
MDGRSNFGGVGVVRGALSMVYWCGVMRDQVEFTRFVGEVEPRLRRALVATYGPERGRDAVAEALGWAWANWSRVQSMGNPAGYLYRVGQSRTRARKRPVVFPDAADVGLPWVEPALIDALRSMNEMQRCAVVLVHGYQWTLGEVAELMGVRRSTVQTLLARGMRRLRTMLEVDIDA